MEWSPLKNSSETDPLANIELDIELWLNDISFNHDMVFIHFEMPTS